MFLLKAFCFFITLSLIFSLFYRQLGCNNFIISIRFQKRQVLENTNQLEPRVRKTTVHYTLLIDKNFV